MLTQQTRQHLRTLRLGGMLRALDEQLAHPAVQELGFEQRLGMLVEREIIERDNRRLDRLLRAAKLRLPACIEDIDYHHARGVDKSRMSSLATLDWVAQGLNLCITGPTGCGKTWLACAIGNQACRRGLTVRYYRLARLLESLRVAQGDGSYARLMKQLLRNDLLILDDWGIQSIGPAQRNDLMEVIEDRHGRRSTLITSQLPIEHWHDYIGEATIADAILDRLLHGAHRLALHGESMRRTSPPPLTDRDRSR